MKACSPPPDPSLPGALHCHAEGQLEDRRGKKGGKLVPLSSPPPPPRRFSPAWEQAIVSYKSAASSTSGRGP